MLLPWLITVAGAQVTVKGILAVIRPKFGSLVARKACHWASGTIFALTWLLYPDSSIRSGLTATSVLILATGKFVLAGLGIFPDALLVDGIGHTGEEHKLLRGPLQYGVMISLVTLRAFRQPLSVITIGVLCGGDACAALAGSKFGKHPIPWNKGKTFEGMAAFVAGAIGTTLPMCAIFAATLGASHNWNASYVQPVFICSMVGAVAESLPTPWLGNADNIVIPCSTLLLEAVSKW